jgi:hypothetical protein
VNHESSHHIDSIFLFLTVGVGIKVVFCHRVEYSDGVRLGFGFGIGVKYSLGVELWLKVSPLGLGLDLGLKFLLGLVLG